MREFIYSPHMINYDPVKYEKYSHVDVQEPVRYGINLSVPPELENKEMADLGLVDITAGPFNADPGGVKDATLAINAAVNFARDHQMVCFFPFGKYRVSDTIECIQNVGVSKEGVACGSRTFPCVLFGSRKSSPARPEIILGEDSAGFNDPNNLKPVIYFWSRSAFSGDPHKSQHNISFNQIFSTIDIVVEKGNCGAIGLQFRGAQGSGVLDTSIDVTHGHTGYFGGIGSGGMQAGIKVRGGKIGIDMSEINPAATLCGATLVDQEETALLFGGITSLACVGLKIISRAGGPVVKCFGGKEGYEFRGNISISDSELTVNSKGNVSALGIETDQNIVLNNVYFRGFRELIQTNREIISAPDPARWTRVDEYAHGVDYEEFKDLANPEVLYKYSSPAYLGGMPIASDIVSMAGDCNEPSDFIMKHLWDQSSSGWESLDAVNVKEAPYYAKGDSFTDDTASLQKAIDENEIIFLPKGYYRITSGIQLRRNTKIIGIAPHLSRIFIRAREDAFSDPDNAKPLVRTAEGESSRNELEFVGIEVPVEETGAFPLKWQCGSKSTFKFSQAGFPQKNSETQIEEPDFLCPRFPPRKHPLILICGSGSGRWYCYWEYISPLRCDPAYRHLLIDGSKGPLVFYHCNPERAFFPEAAMEINNSENISIYGFKYEGKPTALKIKDSRHVRVLGYGGIANPVAGGSLFEVVNSDDFCIANAFDGRMWMKNIGLHWNPSGEGSRYEHISRFIGSTNPRTWNLIIEKTKNSETFKTQNLHRPVIYKQGKPFDA